jgi:hypothetical protein
MFSFLYNSTTPNIVNTPVKQIIRKTRVKFGTNTFLKFFDKEEPSIQVSKLNTFLKKITAPVQAKKKYRKSPAKPRKKK